VLTREIGGFLALDDLDLEFEDEDEAKKKKNEAVQVDVDLEFSTPVGVASKARPQTPNNAQSPPPNAGAPPKPNASPNKTASVANINDARMAKGAVAGKTSQGVPSAQAIKPAVQGSHALSAEQAYFESQQMLEMRERVKKVEFEAEVKVAVAEFKTDFLSELLSDSKLMQHQVEQLLVRMNAKHPDLKQEILLIKKILADFTSKKRK